jgi:hypothetical protein
LRGEFARAGLDGLDDAGVPLGLVAAQEMSGVDVVEIVREGSGVAKDEREARDVAVAGWEVVAVGLEGVLPVGEGSDA